MTVDAGRDDVRSWTISLVWTGDGARSGGKGVPGPAEVYLMTSSQADDFADYITVDDRRSEPRVNWSRPGAPALPRR